MKPKQIEKVECQARAFVAYQTYQGEVPSSDYKNGFENFREKSKQIRPIFVGAVRDRTLLRRVRNTMYALGLVAAIGAVDSCSRDCGREYREYPTIEQISGLQAVERNLDMALPNVRALSYAGIDTIGVINFINHNKELVHARLDSLESTLEYKEYREQIAKNMKHGFAGILTGLGLAVFGSIIYGSGKKGSNKIRKRQLVGLTSEEDVRKYGGFLDEIYYSNIFK